MFSLTCPEPLHRLYALVGQDRIEETMAEGAPSIQSAVAYLVLEEHTPDDWRRAAALMVEAGACNARALDDPEQFWVAVLGLTTGIDPFTGEDLGQPATRARPHRPRRGPFRRR